MEIIRSLVRYIAVAALWCLASGVGGVQQVLGRDDNGLMPGGRSLGGLYSLKPLNVYPDPVSRIKFGGKNNGVNTRLGIKDKQTESVVLEYRFKFSPEFGWGAAGGTLPGILGGRRFCTPNHKSSKCWYIQPGWDQNGRGMMHARLQKYDGEIHVNDFTWKKDSWNTVQMIVRVNDRKDDNGVVQLLANGELVVNQERVLFHHKKTRSSYVLMSSRYLQQNNRIEVGFIRTSDLALYRAELLLSPSPSFPINSPSPAEPVQDPEPAQEPPPSPEPEQSPEASPEPSEDESAPPSDPIVRLLWTTGEMSAVMPEGGQRGFDAAKREMYICSGDIVHFVWSDEPGGMGLYGFYKEEEYISCDKRDVDYIKNTRPNGEFKTKPNRSGWRYYGHLTGADDGACKYGCNTEKDRGKTITGTCAQRIAIHWGKC
eukprot:jgi/Picsp_1/3214/NSC_06054-R1_polysaccharide lyase family 14 protein